MITIVDKVLDDINHRKQKSKAPYENIPTKYIEQLKLENKSERTIEVYTGFVAQFIHYFTGYVLSGLSVENIIILLLLYGFGLRVGAVITLECENINFNKKNMLVKGKGRKQRVLPIPDRILPELRSYMEAYVPTFYFIEGPKKKQYSSSSIQKVITSLSKKAGIKQRVVPHMLRHCYATHLLEKGTGLRYIQCLLGHKSSKTTEIYTHVSVQKLNNLANPTDDIKI